MPRLLVYGVAVIFLLSMSMIGLLTVNNFMESQLPKGFVCFGAAIGEKDPRGFTFQGSGFASTVNPPWGWQQFVLPTGSTAQLFANYHFAGPYASSFHYNESLELSAINTNYSGLLNNTGLTVESKLSSALSDTAVVIFTLKADSHATHATYFTRISSSRFCFGSPLLTIGDSVYKGPIGNGSQAVFPMSQVLAIEVHSWTQMLASSESQFSSVFWLGFLAVPSIWVLGFIWKGIQITRGKKS